MLARSVVCLLLLVATEARAAPRMITLDEAFSRAADGSPTLGRAELAVVEAEATRDAQVASYDARVEIDATGRREIARPRRTPFTQLLARDGAVVSAALTRALAGGGDARFGVALERADATTRIPSVLGHDDVAQTTFAPRIEASVRQPLAGGRQARRATGAQLAALHDAAAFDLAGARAATLHDVYRAYGQLYLAQREVAIRGGARAAAEAQLRQVEAEITRGTRPRLAAAEIEDALARLREDELIAAGAVGERSLELARAIGVAPTTELRAAEVPRELGLDGASGGAPRVLASAARITAAREEVVRTEDEARWRIDAIVAGSLAAPRDELRRALDDTASYGGWTLEVGLVVRGALTDRAAHAARRGARARHRAAQLAHRDAEAELAAELERLRNRRSVASQRRVALGRALELARQNLAAERGRWDRGDTTAFELLRRQAALADTELRLERARIDELDAAVALAAAAGTLRLERSASSARPRS